MVLVGSGGLEYKRKSNDKVMGAQKIVETGHKGPVFGVAECAEPGDAVGDKLISGDDWNFCGSA